MSIQKLQHVTQIKLMDSVWAASSNRVRNQSFSTDLTAFNSRDSAAFTRDHQKS